MATQLQQSLLKEGSKSYLVKIIKEFLNMDFRTPYHLQINNSFDKQTKDALLHYQKTRNLRMTGVTDIHTWRSIGKELDPIKHNILTTSNPTLEFLLNKKRWKPHVHDEIIEKAFYGVKEKNIKNIKKIQAGSRHVDMKYGVYPSTLIVKNVHQHAMRKPNQSIDDAIKETNDYFTKKLDEALKLQNNFLRRYKGLSPDALFALGEATHPIEDWFSPVHGYQEYTIPMKRFQRVNKHGLIEDVEIIDEVKFIKEMLEHSSQENVLPPNHEEYFKIPFIEMRQAFRYVFGQVEFINCVYKKEDQNLVYKIYP